VGNPTQMPRDNTIITTKAFDDEDHITSISDKATSAQEPLNQLVYKYNEVGDRIAVERTVNPDSGQPIHTEERYEYDKLREVIGDEIVEEDVFGQTTSFVHFTYDALGNRITVDENGTVTHYTSNELNQYTQVGDFSPSYDGNGNLAGMGDWLYQYDALNRIVSASNGTMTAQFWYDARNRVVARSYQTADAEKPTLTLNTYEDWNLIEERDESGVQKARYVHGPRIDEIVVMQNEHGIFYPQHDALGSVTMLTDKDGKLAERYSYSVTGEVTIYDANGAETENSAFGNRWMYTGREWLPEVGLYDYRNRIYSAQLGRFLQTDPIKFYAGDLNLYRYVGNGYMSFIDPEGEGLLADWLYIFYVGPDKQYELGRPRTPVWPGSIHGKFIENFLPMAHPFALNHDKFVDYAVGKGWSDYVVNIPSMVPVYVMTVVNTIYNTASAFVSWAMSFWFSE